MFIEYLLNPSNYACQNINVHYNEATSEWWIEGKNYDKYNIKATNTYGTGRASAYKIIEDSLNLKDTRIYDYYEDENGKRVAELNKKMYKLEVVEEEMEIVRLIYKLYPQYKSTVPIARYLVSNLYIFLLF